MARNTIHTLARLKADGERFAMITAYDYPSARLVEQAGIPVILVGDTLGQVVLGYDSTVPVTMDEMIHHTRAVVRGAPNTVVVADMPFMSYQASPEDAIRNAGRLLKDGGATAVKLEGGAHVVETVRRMVECGIPVMGHLGLTPQSINQLGGHKVQGKTPAAAAKIISDARALEQAGAFAVVLETVPAQLAAMVSRRLTVPTIGIGSGPGCDGQVQVWHDLLGLYDDQRTYRHVGQYAVLGETIREALRSYAQDVSSRSFPTMRHTSCMDQETVRELAETIGEPIPALR